MGKLLATEFNGRLFSIYREKPLSGELARSETVRQVTPRTMNPELAYFRTIFNELLRLDEWNAPHPLAKIRLFKTEKREMAFISLNEIEK
ncbi:phage integrase [Brenneria rubrifaciens]|uniref:Phage integrase N-terminal domain-containing protein n=1 Tax=Brenneria rubrifaciens TaxID=55213 RepID=A0A4P8QTJ0_9GAMM|nr:hypothetical protein [Brenneria rubrifaciens]QCR07475.1 hypothetical protein EH207_02250 [Brenneria rubrifaciens]